MASRGNDTDVKIASKAVAIKSNTRPEKLVREGDLLKMEANKKKNRKEMSARKTCSLDIYHGVMVRVKPARFTLFQEREARKRNEEQIERNSYFVRRWNKSQFAESRALLQYFDKNWLKVSLFRSLRFSRLIIKLLNNLYNIRINTDNLKVI